MGGGGIGALLERVDKPHYEHGRRIDVDNFYIAVTHEGRETLISALSIVFSQHSSCIGYSLAKNPKTGRPRMILYWVKPDRLPDGEDFVAFPFKVSRQRRKAFSKHGLPRAADADDRLPWLVDLIIAWLQEADFGKEPDHDGDNGKGWRVYVEDWGHSRHQSMCAIEPAWAMYGK